MRIPNIFHFVFGLKKQTEPFHLLYYLCLESCIQVNSPEKIYLYYHYEPYGPYWDLIKPKLILVKASLPKFIEDYQYQEKIITRFKYAHLADFVRLEKIVEQGGVYADMDTLFVNKLPSFLFTKDFVMGRESDVFCPSAQALKPSLCNAFMMSAPGATFGQLWLAKMEQAFDGSWSKHSCFLPQELSEQYPDAIHIEPPRSFYRHSFTRDGIYTLLQGYDDDYTGIYSMHLWNHLWWDRWRKDFSDFHGDLLTQHYIRIKNTTYNVIARKYLPEICADQSTSLLNTIKSYFGFS